jgi:hypothetical protein
MKMESFNKVELDVPSPVTEYAISSCTKCVYPVFKSFLAGFGCV